MHAPAIAAHRFGFSEPSLRPLSADPRGWVRAQMQQPAALDASGLVGSAEAIQLGRRLQQTVLTQRAQTQLLGSAMSAAQPPLPEPDPARRQLRAASLRGLQRRWQQVVATPTPVYERWVLFWANHFTVAGTKAALVGLVLPFEREAIRPAATGPFVALLRAATLHPAMLLYLDNAQSIGPHSRTGLRRSKGLNENLARELLELHTLGVNGGYTQSDVTELAKLLTGWTVDRSEGGRGQAQFVATLHEPGPKRVLGRTYAEGPQALDALLLDLSRHPGTACHLATQLVRHFVSDAPAPALVDAVAARFRSSDGDLLAVADALFSHDLAWRNDTPPKFKRPEEWLLSAHRVLQLPVTQPELMLQTLTEMGQEVGKAPSPAGWPDRSADWLAPDALWKRVAWAGRFGSEHAAHADARALAAASLGADLRDDTRLQIERAESGGQALALWLLSPEFQRR